MQAYVEEVYDKIAVHFSATRKDDRWSFVTDFLNELPSSAIIADIGCGNGKYIGHRQDFTHYFAVDYCAGLLECARAEVGEERQERVSLIQGTILDIPLLDAGTSAVLCIAVFHHLFGEEERRKAVEELHRILRPGGVALVSVWSLAQRESKRFQKWQRLPGAEAEDYLVPWTFRPHFGRRGVRETEGDREVLYRYYHLFSQEELLSYFCNLFQVERILEDHGNWVLWLRKRE